MEKDEKEVEEKSEEKSMEKDSDSDYDSEPEVIVGLACQETAHSDRYFNSPDF